MPLDPRTPVLVAGGQVNQRTDRGEPAIEPVDLIVEAARRSGAGPLLEALDSIRIVQLLSWRYLDPAALVGERLGATPRHTVYTHAGGNTPQSLVNQAARDIAAGRCRAVLIGGAEAWRTRMQFRGHGDRPDWTVQDESVAPTEVVGAELPMMDEFAAPRGVVMPVQVYPIFEQALRIAAGRSVDDHLVRISELWARFSEVAAANPHAWIQQAMTAEAIRTPGPDNRWVGWPYTKVMNSNNAVEQGAAIVLCSVEAAEAAGIARDRWVFPLAGTDAHDTFAVTTRAELHRSPAIRAAARTALDLAGVGVDDLAHVDLYSCFPSAVQVAAAEVGLPDDDPARPLTVTGGLSFAGGPWNNYVTHSIATMADVLRADPGSLGLITANGGYLTKHAIGLYSTEPPAAGFRWADVQEEVDREPTVEGVAAHDGEATIEAWTVMHGREGAENAIAAVRTPSGARTWVTSTDPAVLETLVTTDVAGAIVKATPDGTLLL